MSLLGSATFVILWLFIYVFNGEIVGFNLEARIPVIKKGPPKSHFGYSVAQHKTNIPGAPLSASKKYESWMLVGAPKGQNLQPGTERSGALFKCPLTTLADDCEQVQTDGLRDNRTRTYKTRADGKILPPSEDEIKNDQWMGVTVKSQGKGGDILVCGHRYQHKGLGEQTFQWGYGLCYRLNETFGYEDNYQPCVGKPVSGYEQFGYCQAGTSGLILKDEVVLGIPGTYTWRGTIYTSNISGEYLWRDKTSYFGVYTDNDSPVQSHSYLGYSVTSGRFFDDHVSYVAGAPKARGTGQVVFFMREKIGNPLMPYDLIIDGEAFASSFGYEVLAMDVNGDKWDDLIVSAPFYFTKSTSGAVYIYLNEGGRISNKTPYKRLEGAPGESRFGHSMTSLGDINLDGYNDLAVGAPYEGRGVIYVYLGSADGIIKEPAQVIRAEDLPGLAYDAFGYSLSGGLDMDGNGYNDLLTSSFCSDRVVLLRARPIIKIQTKVEPAEELLLIDPVQKGCPEDRDSSDTCFSFEACFKMENEAGRETYLQMRYNISERVYKDNPVSRVRFHRAGMHSPSTVEQIIQLKSKELAEYKCSREIVYLQHGVRDVLRPIRFKLTYEIFQQEPKPVAEGRPIPDIDRYPILNQQEAVRYFEASFAQDCGSDEICESDLILNGQLDLEPQKGASGTYYILELGRRQYFTLTTNVTNDMEPAYRPNLYVGHDPAIDLSLRESETGSYQCSTVERGLVHCQLDNPLINSSETFNLVFKPSGLPFTSRFIYLDVWANTTSVEKYPNDNSLRFALEVKRRAEISIIGSGSPEQVFYSGEVVGESALESQEEIGAEVMHKYIVDNRGPWRVEELKVEILWPHQVENNRQEGKWLLYMTEIPYVDGDGECDVDPQYINPIALGRRQGVPEDEVYIGNKEPYTGVTDSSVESSTKITVTKKVTKINEKKTYKKSSSSHSKSKEESSSSSGSSGSSGSSYSSENEHHGSRSHSNSLSSGDEKDRMDRNKDHGRGRNGEYDSYDDFNYEHYDDFFNKKKTGTDYVERRPTEERNRGGSRREGMDYDRKVGTYDYDRKSADALNSVRDFKVVRGHNQTFINGYNNENRLVWSSRDFEPSSSGSGGVHSSTHHYSSMGDSINAIVDFRIIREGDNSWVNGYDKDGELVWSSRNMRVGGSSGSREYRRRTHSVNRVSSSSSRDGEEPHRESSFSEYEYSGRSQNGETEGEHRLTESDRRGERTKSWKSNNRVDSDRGNYDTSRRERFDWSYPSERDRDSESNRGYQSDNRYNDRSGRYDSHDRDYRQNDNYRSDYRRRSDSENRSRHTSDGERDYEGATYTRAVIDDPSEGTNVYTQRVFSRKSGDQWEEVLRAPYADSQWSRDDGHTLNRVKREREVIIKPEAITDSQTGKTMQVVNFRCDGANPTAKCFVFECTIRNLAANQAASIKIVSRLWNSTLVEDYSRVSYVSIKSKGMLILPEEIVYDQDQSDDVDYAETLAYSNLLEQLPPEEAPLWVILVAVLAGLLLLILIAVILWKIGFFKRRRPDPTLSANG